MSAVKRRHPSEKEHGSIEDRTKVDMEPLDVEFKLEQIITEEHRPPQIYSVRFCDILPDYSAYFASVGGNAASVYEIQPNNAVDLKLAFLDEDIDEILYSCAWGAASNGTPLLVVAGLRGMLKGINCCTFELEVVLPGHGNAVNDLRVHPVDDGLMFSASKDESIRLWNLRTAVCIAIFAGEKGHRDEVLSIDPHPLGNCFVSAGMDTSIKVWNLEDPFIQHAITLSYSEPRKQGNQAFETVTQQIPLFSTTQVHNDYVDSVRWVGNCILSKSTKNRVALWAPDSNRYQGAALVLQEFSIVDSDLWFLRMDVCIPLDLFAVGNKFGKVFLYNLSTEGHPRKGSSHSHHPSSSNSINNNNNNGSNNRSASSGAAGFEGSSGNGGVSSVSGNNGRKTPERFECDLAQEAQVVLAHPKCQSTVRHIAFSPGGSHIVYCCDNATIWVWSMKTSSDL